MARAKCPRVCPSVTPEKVALASGLYFGIVEPVKYGSAVSPSQPGGTAAARRSSSANEKFSEKVLRNHLSAMPAVDVQRMRQYMPSMAWRWHGMMLSAR